MGIHGGHANGRFGGVVMIGAVGSDRGGLLKRYGSEAGVVVFRWAAAQRTGNKEQGVAISQ